MKNQILSHFLTEICIFFVLDNKLGLFVYQNKKFEKKISFWGRNLAILKIWLKIGWKKWFLLWVVTSEGAPGPQNHFQTLLMAISYGFGYKLSEKTQIRASQQLSLWGFFQPGHTVVWFPYLKMFHLKVICFLKSRLSRGIHIP